MKKIILAIIAGIIPLVLPAASTDFWFRHFSVEDGLSSTLCVLLCRINMALCGLVRMTA